VAVVGGGYAGMAAAVELAGRGASVTVIEAGKTLGGRARRVEAGGVTLDNGLHILIGAYAETLRLIERTRAAGEPEGLLRMPLELCMYPGFRLRAARLPAPLHLAAALLGARGLGWGERFAAASFMLALRRLDFRVGTDTTVSALLARHRQPARVCRLLWHPLCVSALNTGPDEASAQVFANVLRDSLGGGRAASDLLLPTLDFSALFPERAARFVQAQGGEVKSAATVASFAVDGGGFELAEDLGRYDRLILAVSPHRLETLVRPHAALSPVADAVAAFGYQPIYSVYLQYPPGTRLPFRMAGLEAHYAQWVFDRGQLCGQDGLVGVVISAAGAHQDLPQEELARIVHRELVEHVQALPEPNWQRVIAEKRATFSCTPGLARPDNVTAVPGLFLAGDYTASDYPATLEAAVRSGVRAAALALQHG
jgi:squalene-associated FAD-dependent desaturase